MTNLEIPEPIASFLSAINRGDSVAFLDSFTDSGVVDDWGTKYTWHAAINEWSDRELLGANGTFTPGSVTSDSSTITVVGDWRSSFANGPSSFQFTLTGNEIATMTIREG